MSVVKLTICNFRNLHADSFYLHENLNFIIGDNGSGKSSLLEAIFYLGHAKSFRTTQMENLVSFEQSRFIVSALDHNNKQLGVAKDFSTGLTQIKIDGRQHSRLSELVQNIAVQVITPETFKIFFGGPKQRRRFVDLGLFHVKHHFTDCWKDFSRILKQRNACLRSRAEHKVLDYWTEVFCQSSIEIGMLREEYSRVLNEELHHWLALLLPDISQNLHISYYQGWTGKKTLAEVLHQFRDRELKSGYSLYGAQKFDVKFLLDNIAIEDVLSRGQQKLFLLALTFAQAKLIEKVKRVKPILLIDDVGAELDLCSRGRLNLAIQQLNCQVIITAIDQSSVAPMVSYDKNYKMFHVKHGKISAMSE